jgi:hypothetical protein
MKVPVSVLLLPEPFLPAERKKRAAKRKIQEEAEAARSAAGAHSAESAVAAGSSSGNDRLDHVFAVPKTPSPVPVPAAAATEEAAAARPRRKAGLRPQKREIAAAPSAAEPEVGRHSKQLLFLMRILNSICWSLIKRNNQCCRGPDKLEGYMQIWIGLLFLMPIRSDLSLPFMRIWIRFFVLMPIRSDLSLPLMRLWIWLI